MTMQVDALDEALVNHRLGSSEYLEALKDPVDAGGDWPEESVLAVEDAERKLCVECGHPGHDPGYCEHLYRDSSRLFPGVRVGDMSSATGRLMGFDSSVGT